MKKKDDSEKKLWCLLYMVIKNSGCVKEVSFSYIFILFRKQTKIHHVKCLLACSTFPRIICIMRIVLFFLTYYLYYPI